MKEQDCRTDPNRHKVGQRILFTGPDGIGNYRLRRSDYPGIGDMPPKATGDLNYLFRPVPNTPPWRPINCYVGGVGWGLEHGIRLNARTLLSNTQIKRSEFRSAIETFPSPWQRLPSVLGRQMQSVREDQSADEKHSRGYDSDNQIVQRKKRSAHRKKRKRKSHQSSFTLPPIAGHRTY